MASWLPGYRRLVGLYLTHDSLRNSIRVPIRLPNCLQPSISSDVRELGNADLSRLPSYMGRYPVQSQSQLREEITSTYTVLKPWRF